MQYIKTNQGRIEVVNLNKTFVEKVLDLLHSIYSYTVNSNTINRAVVLNSYTISYTVNQRPITYNCNIVTCNNGYGLGLVNCNNYNCITYRQIKNYSINVIVRMYKFCQKWLASLRFSCYCLNWLTMQ